MTSQLNVDTIVDKAGSGGTNVKVANTSTYVSDNGNVTQNTVQGLAKSWLNLNGILRSRTPISYICRSIAYLDIRAARASFIYNGIYI